MPGKVRWARHPSPYAKPSTATRSAAMTRNRQAANGGDNRPSPACHGAGSIACPPAPASSSIAGRPSAQHFRCAAPSHGRLSRFGRGEAAAGPRPRGMRQGGRGEVEGDMSLSAAPPSTPRACCPPISAAPPSTPRVCCPPISAAPPSTPRVYCPPMRGKVSPTSSQRVCGKQLQRSAPSRRRGQRGRRRPGASDHGTTRPPNPLGPLEPRGPVGPVRRGQ